MGPPPLELAFGSSITNGIRSKPWSGGLEPASRDQRGRDQRGRWSLRGDEYYGLTQGKDPTSTVWEVVCGLYRTMGSPPLELAFAKCIPIVL